jgi:hypothetical protein
MKYYEVESYWSPKISCIEVEKETDVSIWVKGRRLAKRSEYRSYFPSFEAAKAFLLDTFTKKAEGIRRHLQDVNGKLGNIIGMQEAKE